MIHSTCTECDTRMLNGILKHREGCSGNRDNTPVDKIIQKIEIDSMIALAKSREDGDPKHHKKMIADARKAMQAHINTILKDVTEKLEGGKIKRTTDMEYGYCITCDQIIDSGEADCFCTINNLTLDTAIQIVKEKM